MDPTTIQYYALRAAFVADQYAGTESTAAKYFALAFPAGSRVLDIGCGSGRDLHALLAAGYDAQGVDASEEMLREAAGRYPDLQGRLQKDALPALATVQDASAERKTGLDGLVCWAILMHVPEEQLFDVVFNLRRVLKPGGRLLISTPRTGPAVDEATRRDTDGRLFNGVTHSARRRALGTGRAPQPGTTATVSSTTGIEGAAGNEGGTRTRFVYSGSTTG